MAEEKLNTGPEGQIGLGDVVKDEPGGGVGGPGDVEVSAEQIEALMAEKKAAERAALEREEAGGEKAPEAGGPKKDGPPAPERDPRSEDEKNPWERPLADLEAEKTPARRGRRPKAEPEAPGKATPGKRDKMDLLTKYHT